VLRGFLQSLKACEQHLMEWENSTERQSAVLAHMLEGRSVVDVFEKWADGIRALKRSG